MAHRALRDSDLSPFSLRSNLYCIASGEYISGMAMAFRNGWPLGKQLRIIL